MYRRYKFDVGMWLVIACCAVLATHYQDYGWLCSSLLAFLYWLEHKDFHRNYNSLVDEYNSLLDKYNGLKNKRGEANV